MNVDHKVDDYNVNDYARTLKLMRIINDYAYTSDPILIIKDYNEII